MMRENIKARTDMIRLQNAETSGSADDDYVAVSMKAPSNQIVWNMRLTANSRMDIQFAVGTIRNVTYSNSNRMGMLLSLPLVKINPGKRLPMYCEMQTLMREGIESRVASRA